MRNVERYTHRLVQTAGYYIRHHSHLSVQIADCYIHRHSRGNRWVDPDLHDAA